MADKSVSVQQVFSGAASSHMPIARQFCPPGLIELVLGVTGSINRWIWCLNPDGNFTSKSVRCLLQGENAARWSMLWSPHIPMKWSILVWRLIRGCIPTDETIAKCGIPLCSRCSCCQFPQNETSLHLFFFGKVANEIWTELYPLLQFSNLSISTVAHGVTDYLLELHYSSLAGNLSRCIFMAVLWEIWCCRNGSRFEGQPMVARHILCRAMLSVRAIFQAYQFKGNVLPPHKCTVLDYWGINIPASHPRPPRLIRWINPPKGRLKLNVDGAFKRSNNAAGGGGILRDTKGDIIFAFAASSYLVHSSLEAEGLALRDGLSICCEMGISTVIVESDSLVLVQIMKGSCPCPWRMTYIMHEVASQARQLGFTINHIYREANQVADCLAGIGCSMGSTTTIWTSWAELPTAAKGPYRLDKIGYPSLRL